MILNCIYTIGYVAGYGCYILCCRMTSCYWGAYQCGRCSSQSLESSSNTSHHRGGYSCVVPCCMGCYDGFVQRPITPEDSVG